MKLSYVVKSLVLTGMIAFAAKSASAQTPLLGEIKLVSFNFAPQGYMLCDGSILPINQFSAIFSLMGTTYGGNGQTNFALPDLRGRVAVGAGQGPGLSPRIQGEVGGRESVTLTIAQMPAHSHPIVASSSEATLSSPTNNVMAGKARVPLYNGILSTDTTMAPTATVGGNQPFDARPPYLVLNYIIAIEGIFPSRG